MECSDSLVNFAQDVGVPLAIILYATPHQLERIPVLQKMHVS